MKIFCRFLKNNVDKQGKICYTYEARPKRPLWEGEKMENRNTNDEDLIRGRLGALRMSVTSFAEQMGFSRATARRKLNGEIQFRSKEIIKACEILKIPYEEAHLYFF